MEGFPACVVGAHELGKDDKFLLDIWMEDFGNYCRDKNSPAWMRTGSIVDQWSGIATESKSHLLLFSVPTSVTHDEQWHERSIMKSDSEPFFE